jgi:anti-anti-sigma factor
MSGIPGSRARLRPRPFRVGLRPAGSRHVVLDMHGEVDSFAAQALQDCFGEALAQRPTTILLNFGGVDYINSTGIALIVGLLAQARTAGVELVTYGLSEHYEEIFRITRLSDFIRIVADEAAALA